MGLAQYKAKRNFSRTREPAGRKLAQITRRRSHEKFVIQKHAASRLHYDFRLEMDGVLKSWAVPKGIPTAQGDKRLAMQVEDHPVEYARFEGTIPPGNYGAGTVMLWDRGTYEVIGNEPQAALEKGKLVLQLDGKKLKGQWTMIRMRPRDDGQGNAWLLIKTEAPMRSISARAEDMSVHSGRTMKQIATGARKTWKSNRAETSTRSATARSRTAAWKAGRIRRST